MGTRGIMGVRIDGEDKLTYNHFDSYPEGLGFTVLNDAKVMVGDWGMETLLRHARKLKMVSNEDKPTKDDIETFKDFADLTVGDQSADDWYCLLRDLQGKLRDTLIVGYAIDNKNFIKDSLFCEWGYILNLDDKVLEVYRGFQTEPHDKGRYAKEDVEETSVGTYYPCAMIVSFPLDNLPEENDFFIAINIAPFECVEEAVLYHLKEYSGEISAEEAAERYGIDNLGEVIESIEASGVKIDFDGELYSLEG